ncbi:histidine phosphatase family protein [Mesonia sp. HuA40]|uniref:SixA phosphatase family protein n=1 Tax=Mesonia sp. HuA40 TaxID=2602761 RepID=UPI0011CB38A4|nr:histidine phosphatase family protein [Mesonia sp. HuA40]TXK71094.1 histidine phosphatase family protein [Mesonia sp. HuA40]
MKSLILVRHGKSSWKENLPDKMRPLKKRAFRDANLVLDALKPNLKVTSKMLVLSSTATRAITTAQLFKQGLNVSESEFKRLDALYTFNHENLIDIIQQQHNKYNTIILFGHNPAFTNLVNLWGDKSIINIPTTGLVKIDFPDTEDWSKLKQGSVDYCLYPKNLRNE